MEPARLKYSKFLMLSDYTIWFSFYTMFVVYNVISNNQNSINYVQFPNVQETFRRTNTLNKHGALWHKVLRRRVALNRILMPSFRLRIAILHAR